STAVRGEQADPAPPQQEVRGKQSHFVIALIEELGTQVGFVGMGWPCQGRVLFDVRNHVRCPAAVAVDQVPRRLSAQTRLLQTGNSAVAKRRPRLVRRSV